MPMEPEISLAREILSSVERALSEDIGIGDVTTDSIIPSNAFLEGRIVSKQAGIVAGLSVARAAFQLLDEHVAFRFCVSEGKRVQASQVLAEISGSAREILTAERTAVRI